MKKNSGFTLIELLITLVIISALVMTVVPMGQKIYQKNQLDVIEHEIINAVTYARNTAFESGKTLTMTPINGKNWSNGMVLSDVKNMVYQWQWHFSGINVTWHGFRSDNYLIFSSELAKATASGSFVISSQYGQKKLTINRLGRIRS